MVLLRKTMVFALLPLSCQMHLLHRHGRFMSDFLAPLGPSRAPFETLWPHCGLHFGHLGATLGLSFWVPRFGRHFGPSMGHFWITFGSLLAPFWSTLVSKMYGFPKEKQ